MVALGTGRLLDGALKADAARLLCAHWARRCCCCFQRVHCRSPVLLTNITLLKARDVSTRQERMNAQPAALLPQASLLACLWLLAIAGSSDDV